MKKAYVVSYTVGCIVSTVFTSLVTRSIGIQFAILALPLVVFLPLLFVLEKRCRKTIIIEAIMIAYATGAFLYAFLSNVNSVTFDTFSFTIAVYFILQTVFAVLSPNVPQNSTFGIRTPMALDHKEVWQRTHKFLSFSETATLPLMFSLIIFSSGWARFLAGTVLVLLPLSISSIYSAVIGQKYQEQMYEEIKRQEELEESGSFLLKK